MFAYAFVGRDHTGSSLSDQVYAAQTQVIRNLAEKGSCIIIGRCADYILKDRPDTYHIFVVETSFFVHITVHRACILLG